MVRGGDPKESGAQLAPEASQGAELEKAVTRKIQEP